MGYKHDATPEEMCSFAREEVDKITETHNIKRGITVSWVTYSTNTDYFIEIQDLDIDEGFFMNKDPLIMLARFKEWAKRNDNTEQ